MNKANLYNFFRTLIAFLAMTVPLASALAANGPTGRQSETGRKSNLFHGAWFDVRHPAGFTPKPSLESSTADGYDSAEFISADGTVSFYVFAPQWGGTAVDIALDPEHEQLVSEQQRRVGDRQLRWFTIAARDGSYCRSYQETVARQGSVTTVVGIKYRNEADRLRFQKAYERFRTSLKLYAD